MRVVQRTCFLILLVVVPALAGPKQEAQKDIQAALDQIEDQCKHLLKTKKIKWGPVRAQFKKEARKVKSLQDHYALLCRLIARVRDGHAYVQTKEKVTWPGPMMRSIST